MNEANNEKHTATPTLQTTLAALAADTRGAGLVEYVILIGLIALIAASGFGYFGGKVNDKARDLGDRVQNIESEGTQN